MSDEPPDPGVELVAVFRASDPGITALAKSILDSEGIDYMVRGEDLQDLIGYGRALGGFNIVTGPVEFVVRKEDEDRAVELLRDLSASAEVTDVDQRRDE